MMPLPTIECPICSEPNCGTGNSINNSTGFDCPRCGKYRLSASVGGNISFYKLDPQTAAKLSHWIRINQRDGSPPFIDDEQFEDIINNYTLPNPMEQANNFLLLVGSHQQSVGQYVDFYFLDILSLIGCVNKESILFLTEFLTSEGLLKIEEIDTVGSGFQLTMKGWQEYERLQQRNVDSRLAFMAMKFGNTSLDRIFLTVIKPAVSQTGFDIRRLDENPQAGLIDDKLRVEIRRSRFLIADLTDGNNGAYWEAGFAEGIGIPVIYICKKSVFEDNDKKQHFDTNHHLTVIWEDTPEGLEKFAGDLKATIRATLPAEAKMEG